MATTAAGGPRRILLTGASGFVGSHLARRLVGRGDTVTCVLRAGSDAAPLDGLALRLERCGLEDPAALRRIVAGHDTVLHVAGAVKAAGYDGFLRANADATSTLAEACLAADPAPRRLVLMSSLAVCGPAGAGARITEAQPPCPVTDYARSKLEGERRALAVADRMEMIVVRPSPVYGPRDRELLPLFRAAARGFLPAFAGPAQRLNLAHVDDIVEGTLRAADRPLASGRVFLLGGPADASMAEIRDLFAKVLQRPVRLLPVPRVLLDLAAFVSETVSRWRGAPALFSRQKVPELVGDWPVDGTLAGRELGYEPRVGLDEGFAATFRWYRAQGLL